MKIVPSIGRVVWYWRSKEDRDDNGQPNAALVAYVHAGDTYVNLAVFDANGVPRPQTWVRMVQEGEEIPDTNFCEWMPYQLQTAKRDAAAS